MATLMTLQAADVNGGSTYTFVKNPASIQRVHKKKFTAVIPTYTSSAIFNWGFHSVESGLIGARYVLRWPMLFSSGDWATFVLFYQSAQTVTWDAKDKAHTGGAKYQVAIMRLDGDDLASTTRYKQNVEMEFEIRKVV